MSSTHQESQLSHAEAHSAITHEGNSRLSDSVRTHKQLLAGWELEPQSGAHPPAPHSPVIAQAPSSLLMPLI